MERLIRTADVDGDGFISPLEFKAMIRKKQRAEKVPEQDKLHGNELDYLYNMIDNSLAGTLKSDYLIEALKVGTFEFTLILIDV
jgi:EF hand